MNDRPRWYEDDRIRFAVGMEDTFVPQTRVGERALDEYELTQHYTYWHLDLGLAKESGAEMIRWGIPWYRVNPERGAWDWSWLDEVVDRFDELGIVPIVDLMHYGTPLWLDNQFLNERYPEAVAEYARRVAERYRGRLNVFTPLNEPMLNAVYCGEFAHWPPYLSGDDGLVKIVRAIARGIVLTQRVVTEVTEGEASFVHVEASFRFEDPSGSFVDEARHLRERAYLIEDLVTGKVGDEHPLVPWLRDNGFNDDDFAWFRDNTALPDVMGVNYYPIISTELFVEGEAHTGGPLDSRPRTNSWTEGLEDVLTAFAKRYERPVFLTETCYTGTVQERIAWLDASVAHVRELRSKGLDVVGYTWWAVTDMMEWTYRQDIQPPEAYRLTMGLWDLVLDGAGQYQRRKNAVAARFHDHATADRAER